MLTNDVISFEQPGPDVGNMKFFTELDVWQLLSTMHDGWMTWNFMPFSTVFQSYQDDAQVIMKGCVQWILIYSWDFPSSRVQIQDR